MLHHFSNSRLFATLWTNPTDCRRQAPLSMGFSRQEYWSGLPFPPPGDLPHPGIKLMSLNVFCIVRRVLNHQGQLESHKEKEQMGNPQIQKKRSCLVYAHINFFFFSSQAIWAKLHVYRAVFSSVNWRIEEFHKPLCNYLV